MSKFNTLVARAVASCCIILLCAATTTAQSSSQRSDVPPAAPAASPTPAPTEPTGEPDLSITANVTARELLFEVVPTPRVEFPGRPRRDIVWEAERTNLPPQVQPGVTYRDIGIRLRITSVFADIERIVAEALGEIPASDDAPPKVDSNENAQPPATAPATAGEASRPVGRDALPATSLTQTSPASPPPAQTTGARGRSSGSRDAEMRQVKP